MNTYAYYDNMFIFFFVQFGSNNILDSISQINEFLMFSYSIVLDTLFACAVERDEAPLRCNCRQKKHYFGILKVNIIVYLLALSCSSLKTSILISHDTVTFTNVHITLRLNIK
jgi:hypothetical protein